MQNFFSAPIIKRIEDALFLMAEDGTALHVRIEDLQQQLADEFPTTSADTDTVLECCLLLLRLAGVLNLPRLEQGEICFLSYPARTVGLSLLRLLARQSLPGDGAIYNRGFWTETESPEIKKERRHLLEKTAEYLDNDPDEPPVRYSHVSFALLHCNGYFLCHPREIEKDDGDSKKGSLVLPGGRVELQDFPSGCGDQAEQLSQLAGPEGLKEHAETIHENTLKRELKEELKGLTDSMYEAKLFKKLPPYRGRHGGGDKHALTSTTIWLYQISLKPEALPVMLPYFSQESSRLWVSAEELLQTGQTSAGEKIFLDAGRDHITLDELKSLEDSMAFFCNEASSDEEIILSFSSCKATIGPKGNQKKAGRPKAKQEIQLTEDQSQLLLALGIAQWNFTFPRETAPRIRYSLSSDHAPLCEESGGGLRFTDKQIATIFSSFPTEIQDHCWRNGNYIRLQAEFLMSPDCFFYELMENNGENYVRIWKRDMELRALGLSCPRRSFDLTLTDGTLSIFEGSQREKAADLLRKTRDGKSNIPLPQYIAEHCMDWIFTARGILRLQKGETS
ncbi:hypothetical protein [Desulfovibrio piger]|uniref:hypothetical protein n=1 Tax=Desulfovibrio piger TaxID=901 RepID=UPI0026EF3EBB|nr:hypothetical protein [Desulfovibrio piger]